MEPYTSTSSLLSPGRIGQAAWSETLLDHAKTLRQANDADLIAHYYHELGADCGMNPDLALAQFCEETGYGTSDRWVRQRNPAGLGITDDSVLGVTFLSPLSAIQSHYAHLAAYAYTAADCPIHMLGWKDIRPHFHDGNPALSHLQDNTRKWATKPGYVARILAITNAILSASQPLSATTGGTMAPRIAIASGHHNSSGGDEFEKAQTGPLCAAVAKHCRALGMDVRVVQPGDGLGTIDGSLDVVGNTVVKWTTAGWVPDIFLEVHTEGGGGTGVFAIFPDWDSDVDTDVRDRLGPMVAKAVAQLTGLGVRGNGTMSEKRSGVGISGFRLGIFRTTAPIAASTTRLIVEYGAHDREPDLSIAKGPNFADRCGRATAGAFAEFLNWTPPGGTVAKTTTSTGTAAGDAVVVTPFISEAGHACVTIDFGGTVTQILGVDIQDVGITGKNAAGKVYSRSVQKNEGQPWH